MTMMRCPREHRIIPEADDRFCYQCGAALIPALACAKCGRPLARGLDRYCGKCGQAVPEVEPRDSAASRRCARTGDAKVKA